MGNFFQQNQQQTANGVLARIMAATTLLFPRREPAIRGLEVSDSTWEDWEEAICKDRQEGVPDRN